MAHESQRRGWWRGNVTGIIRIYHVAGGIFERQGRSMNKTELTATDVRCDILMLQQVAEDVSEQAVASADVHGLA